MLGWDCLGCAEVSQSRALGTPEINSLGLYPDKSDRRSSASIFAGHYGEGIGRYRRAADRTPGAILLFRVEGRPVHCGLYLGQGAFLHASRQADTIISDIGDTDYASFASDYYLPA